MRVCFTFFSLLKLITHANDALQAKETLTMPMPNYNPALQLPCQPRLVLVLVPVLALVVHRPPHPRRNVDEGDEEAAQRARPSERRRQKNDCG